MMQAVPPLVWTKLLDGTWLKHETRHSITVDCPPDGGLNIPLDVVGLQWRERKPFSITTCPAPCPKACQACTRDRDCECYAHQEDNNAA